MELSVSDSESLRQTHTRLYWSQCVLTMLLEIEGVSAQSQLSVPVQNGQSLPDDVEPAVLVAEFLSSAVSVQLCSGHSTLLLQCKPAPLQLDAAQPLPQASDFQLSV